jgi:hypothetical protein
METELLLDWVMAVGGPVVGPKPKIRVTAGIAPTGQATTGGSLLQNALSKVKSVPYLGRVASPSWI